MACISPLIVPQPPSSGFPDTSALLAVAADHIDGLTARTQPRDGHRALQALWPSATCKPRRRRAPRLLSPGRPARLPLLLRALTGHSVTTNRRMRWTFGPVAVVLLYCLAASDAALGLCMSRRLPANPTHSPLPRPGSTPSPPPSPPFTFWLEILSPLG